MIHIDTTIVNFVLGTIIPVITALVVKDVASPGVKATVNAVLAVIAGALTVTLQAGGLLNWQSLVISVVMTVGASVAAYFGILKPIGVTGAISTSTVNFGIGNPTLDKLTQAPAPIFVPGDSSMGTLGKVVVWNRNEIPVNIPFGNSSIPPVAAEKYGALLNPQHTLANIATKSYVDKVFDQDIVTNVAEPTKVARPIPSPSEEIILP